MDDDLKRNLDEMESRLKSEIAASAERVEERLLSAFRGWARTMEVRVRQVSSAASSMDERLALLEDRLSDLERRKSA
jgi:type II secretory pathway predicted ATPase ExeA